MLLRDQATRGPIAYKNELERCTWRYSDIKTRPALKKLGQAWQWRPYWANWIDQNLKPNLF